MSQLAAIYDVWDGNAEAMAADINEKPVTVRHRFGEVALPEPPEALARADVVPRQLPVVLFVVQLQEQPEAVGGDPAELVGIPADLIVVDQVLQRIARGLLNLGKDLGGQGKLDADRLEARIEPRDEPEQRADGAVHLIAPDLVLIE